MNEIIHFGMKRLNIHYTQFFIILLLSISTPTLRSIRISIFCSRTKAKKAITKYRREKFIGIRSHGSRAVRKCVENEFFQVHCCA